MTNDDILQTAMWQSASDSGCAGNRLRAHLVARGGNPRAQESPVLLRGMVEHKIGAQHDKKQLPPCLGRTDGKKRRIRGRDEQGRPTMILLIAGATHTGKTVLAQRLLEKYKFPYFSIDYQKMGLVD